MQFLAALKHSEQITQKTNWNSAVSGECSPTSSAYTLCTHTEHPFPPSLDRETVVASLLGHSCLVALCSLAFSQGGQ